jgi:hypothetical protein
LLILILPFLGLLIKLKQSGGQKMPKQKKRLTRRSWTGSDVVIMKKLIKQHKPAKLIASKLKRSEGAVRVRAFLEGISFKSVR